MNVDLRGLPRACDLVLLEILVQHDAAVAIENPVLVQSIRDALEDTAVDLAFKQHRVHGTSAIVDGPNLLDLDDTGFGIHSHLCEVNAAISHAAGLRLALRALAVTGVVVF